MLLPLLNPYVDAALALALAVCITGILLSLEPYVGKLPIVGSTLAGWLRAMAKAITGAAGKIVQPIDKAVGGSLQALGGFVTHSYNEVRKHAGLLLGIAAFLTPLASAIAALHDLVQKLVHGHAAQGSEIKKLEKEYHGIEHQVKTLQREFKGIDETGIRKKLGTLDKEITNLETQTIPKIKSEADSASSDVIALGGLFGISFPLPRTTTLEKVGLGILTALGLNWLRCDSNPFNRNKNACGMWGDLSDLLGLATVAVAAADFQELVKEAQALEHDVTVAIKTLWNIE